MTTSLDEYTDVDELIWLLTQNDLGTLTAKARPLGVLSAAGEDQTRRVEEVNNLCLDTTNYVLGEPCDFSDEGIYEFWHPTHGTIYFSMGAWYKLDGSLLVRCNYPIGTDARLQKSGGTVPGGGGPGGGAGEPSTDLDALIDEEELVIGPCAIFSASTDMGAISGFPLVYEASSETFWSAAVSSPSNGTLRANLYHYDLDGNLLDSSQTDYSVSGLLKALFPSFYWHWIQESFWGFYYTSGKRFWFNVSTGQLVTGVSSFQDYRPNGGARIARNGDTVYWVHGNSEFLVSTTIAATSAPDYVAMPENYGLTSVIIYRNDYIYAWSTSEQADPNFFKINISTGAIDQDWQLETVHQPTTFNVTGDGNCVGVGGSVAFEPLTALFTLTNDDELASLEELGVEASSILFTEDSTFIFDGPSAWLRKASRS